MSRVKLRPTRPEDLPFVHETETAPENRPFIRRWSDEEHRAAMADPDWLHLIAEDDGRPLGYLIAAGLERPDAAIYLQRIAMAERGRGHGTAALEALRRQLFDERGARRLWLRVYENNTRARRVYASLGFVEEKRVPASDPADPVRIVMTLS